MSEITDYEDIVWRNSYEDVNICIWGGIWDSIESSCNKCIDRDVRLVADIFWENIFLTVNNPVTRSLRGLVK